MNMKMILLFINIIINLMITFSGNPSLLHHENNTVPLIPKDILFGNPDKVYAQLSFDGKVLAYLAPLDGVLNLWIQPINQLLDGRDTAKAITFDKERGIVDFWWTYLDGVLIYTQDNDGDENDVLYKLDITSQTPTATPLTGRNGTKAEVSARSWMHRDQLIIAENNQDRRFFDLFLVNITSGTKELILRNDRFFQFAFDNDLNVRIALEDMEDGSTNYYKATTSTNGTSWTWYKRFSLEDQTNSWIAGFDKTNTKLYWVTSEGRNLNALYISDFDTPDIKKLLYEPKRSDINEYYFHPMEKTLLAIEENYDYPFLHVIDESIRKDIDYLSGLETEGRLSIQSMSLDMKTWLVKRFADNSPSKYYIYDRVKRKATYLFVTMEALLKYKLARMKAVEVNTRDGKKEICYITIPLQADPQNSGKPSTPIPMVLAVHGGPWDRDTWGLNREVQLFANRGYAVLQCNFRASTGYGKEWSSAIGEWGKKMQDDLLDGVQWAVESKIADPNKIAIFGGSYGGYATLIGLTFTPDTFACGVDVVGISNLETWLNTVPPYWKSEYNSLIKLIGGDPNTAEARHIRQTHGMVDSLNPKKVYVQAWYPVLIEQLKTVENKSTQTDDFDSQMNRYLEEYDKELEVSDIIDRMNILGDFNFIEAFDQAVMHKTFSSEEERNDVKRRVLDKLFSG